MADVENKDVTSDSLGDATHQEGTDYIKDKLAGKADTTAATEGAETTTTSKDTEGAVATDGTDESKKEPTDTSGDDDHKPPKPAGDPKQMENRDAIPAAGGEKLGEKHWGESKIVPDNPKPKDEEGAGVASKDGQPSQEVSDNTAKNTGGATGGPSDSKDAQKKGKFMDKIKSKFNKDKA